MPVANAMPFVNEAYIVVGPEHRFKSCFKDVRKTFVDFGSSVKLIRS